MDNFYSELIHASNEGHTDSEEYVEETLYRFKTFVSRLNPKEVIKMMLSTQNYMTRSTWRVDERHDVKVGDVCYIDYGQAYLNEAGYQHFGLIISRINGKVLTIPMTSNPTTYAEAFHPETNPKGKRHLMPFGQRCGLHKPSVLFLNDAKFINPNRVINVIGHLDSHDEDLMYIRKILATCLFKD